MRGATRTSDVVAHEGGGRFVVLGPGSGLHAQELERRIRVGLAQGRLTGGGQRAARLSVEAGAAVLAPWDEGGLSDLLVRAEQALAQRRALRRSTPSHGWGRRRNDRAARPERPQA
nr:diguanylate cyclase [Kineococcus aurantiacus]